MIAMTGFLLERLKFKNTILGDKDRPDNFLFMNDWHFLPLSERLVLPTFN